MVKYICFIILALTAASCSRSGQPASDGAFSQPLYEPRYASGFRIAGEPDRESVEICVFNPWQGADSIVERLLILRAGEEAPTEYQGQVIKGNAERIVAMSSTHIALLDALGETGKVVGVSGIDYISNPCIRAKKGDIADVGYDSHIDFEALLAADPDLVLLYGVNGASSIEKKLRDLSIPYLYIGDYLEESPLGKAEWMVALGEITGSRSKAEKAFGGIAARYEALKRKVEQHAAARPGVMLNVPYADSWFMPSSTSYMARLIGDAGGRYVYGKDTGSVSRPVGMEEALLLASEADVWLNLDRMGSLGEIKRRYPRFADVKSVSSGEVYNNTLRANPAGGNDFYESGITHPDVILRDLVGILHPELSDSPLHYYKHLK